MFRTRGPSSVITKKKPYNDTMHVCCYSYSFRVCQVGLSLRPTSKFMLLSFIPVMFKDSTAKVIHHEPHYYKRKVVESLNITGIKDKSMNLDVGLRLNPTWQTLKL